MTIIMQTWQTVLIVIGIIAVVICAVVCGWLLVTAQRRKKGVLALGKVSGKLNRFAGIRSFKVLSDVTLKTGKKDTVTIDRVLITFNHVILFKVQSEYDTIYGDAKDSTWVSVRTDRKTNDTISKTVFDNPFREAQRANDAVRRLLTQNKLGKVQTEFYVVFGDPKVNLSIGRGMPVLNLKALGQLLSRSKYSEDGPVDVAEVAKLLSNG